MTQRKAPVTLTTISANDIYQLAELFTRQRPRPPSRGRKPLYPEALILTLALLQVARRASYRQLRFGLAPEVLPNHALPALGTLLYRFQTIPESRWHEFLTWLAEQGLALEPLAEPLEKPLVWVDGTGWGYATPYYAQYRCLGDKTDTVACEGGGVGLWKRWRGVVGGGVVGEGVCERIAFAVSVAGSVWGDGGAGGLIGGVMGRG